MQHHTKYVNEDHQTRTDQMHQLVETQKSKWMNSLGLNIKIMFFLKTHTDTDFEGGLCEFWHLNITFPVITSCDFLGKHVHFNNLSTPSKLQ